MSIANEGPRQDLPIGDAERARVIDVLRAHTAAGRLTLGEFSERADAVLTARSRSDLDQITADLPAQPGGRSRPRRAGRWEIALMGDCRRKGRWRAAAKTRAVAVMGDVSLDYRTAFFDGPEIDVTAVALMGDVVIVVPAGMNVELSGTALLGDNNLQVAAAPDSPGLPVLRVRAFAGMGDVTIRT